MSMLDLTSVFGWMLGINLILYALTALAVMLARDRLARLHARLTGVPARDWPGYYVGFLSRYKLAILIFNLAPYLALRMVF